MFAEQFLKRLEEQGLLDEAIVAELRSITAEIDDLTKAILDTITLETALKSTRLRKEALAAGK